MCTAKYDQNCPLIVNTTNRTFIIFLPENYNFNLALRRTSIINVQRNIPNVNEVRYIFIVFVFY